MSSNKQIKEKISQKIKTCLESPDGYKKDASFLIKNLSNELYYKEVIDSAKKVITAKSDPASCKFLALQLVKESMDTQNQKLASYVASNLLSKLKDLAKHEKHSSSETRGRTLFGKKADPEYAGRFFILLLECLQEWPNTYPMEGGKMSKFTQTYRDLIADKVVFPSTRRYFVSNMAESKKEPRESRTSIQKKPETPKEPEVKPKLPTQQQQPKRNPKDFVKVLDDKLKTIEDQLQVVREGINEGFNSEVMSSLFESIEEHYKAITDNKVIDELLAINELFKEKESESVLSKILDTNDIADIASKVIDEHKLFQQKKQSLDDLKTKVSIFIDEYHERKNPKKAQNPKGASSAVNDKQKETAQNSKGSLLKQGDHNFPPGNSFQGNSFNSFEKPNAVKKTEEIKPSGGKGDNATKVGKADRFEGFGAAKEEPNGKFDQTAGGFGFNNQEVMNWGGQKPAQDWNENAAFEWGAKQEAGLKETFGASEEEFGRKKEDMNRSNRFNNAPQNPQKEDRPKDDRPKDDKTKDSALQKGAPGAMTLTFGFSKQDSVHWGGTEGGGAHEINKTGTQDWHANQETFGNFPSQTKNTEEKEPASQWSVDPNKLWNFKENEEMGQSNKKFLTSTNEWDSGVPEGFKGGWKDESDKASNIHGNSNDWGVNKNFEGDKSSYEEEKSDIIKKENPFADFNERPNASHQPKQRRETFELFSSNIAFKDRDNFAKGESSKTSIKSIKPEAESSIHDHKSAQDARNVSFPEDNQYSKQQTSSFGKEQPNFIASPHFSKQGSGKFEQSGVDYRFQQETVANNLDGTKKNNFGASAFNNGRQNSEKELSEKGHSNILTHDGRYYEENNQLNANFNNQATVRTEEINSERESYHHKNVLDQNQDNFYEASDKGFNQKHLGFHQANQAFGNGESTFTKFEQQPEHIVQNQFGDRAMNGFDERTKETDNPFLKKNFTFESSQNNFSEFARNNEGFEQQGLTPTGNFPQNPSRRGEQEFEEFDNRKTGEVGVRSSDEPKLGFNKDSKQRESANEDNNFYFNYDSAKNAHGAKNSWDEAPGFHDNNHHDDQGWVTGDKLKAMVINNDKDQEGNNEWGFGKAGVGFEDNEERSGEFLDEMAKEFGFKKPKNPEENEFLSFSAFNSGAFSFNPTFDSDEKGASTKRSEFIQNEEERRKKQIELEEEEYKREMRRREQEEEKNKLELEKQAEMLRKVQQERLLEKRLREEREMEEKLRAENEAQELLRQREFFEQQKRLQEEQARREMEFQEQERIARHEEERARLEREERARLEREERARLEREERARLEREERARLEHEDRLRFEHENRLRFEQEERERLEREERANFDRKERERIYKQEQEKAEQEARNQFLREQKEREDKENLARRVREEAERTFQEQNLRRAREVQEHFPLETPISNEKKETVMDSKITSSFGNSFFEHPKNNEIEIERQRKIIEEFEREKRQLKEELQRLKENYVRIKETGQEPQKQEDLRQTDKSFTNLNASLDPTKEFKGDEVFVQQENKQLKKCIERISNENKIYKDKIEVLAERQNRFVRGEVNDFYHPPPQQLVAEPSFYGYEIKKPLVHSYQTVFSKSKNSIPKPAQINSVYSVKILRESSSNKIYSEDAFAGRFEVRYQEHPFSESGRIRQMPFGTLTESVYRTPTSNFVNENLASDSLRDVTSFKIVKYGRTIKTDWSSFENAFSVSTFSEPLDVNNYKYCCLNKRAVLVENSLFQIGICSAFQRGEKDFLNLQIHYSNKSADVLVNFHSKIIPFAPGVFKPGNEPILQYEEIDGHLYPNTKTKHSVTSTLPREIHVTMAKIDFVLDNRQEKFLIPLPISLLKFMEFEFIDYNGFKSNWKKLKAECISSEELDFNPKFLKEIDDFKRYFPELIDCSKKYGFLSNLPSVTNRKKLGGCFILDSIRHWILIKEYNRGQIVMRIAADIVNLSMMIAALNTLTYVFCASYSF